MERSCEFHWNGNPQPACRRKVKEEFLVPLRLSANPLAIELKVPAPRINGIVRERRAVTPDTALKPRILDGPANRL